MSQCEYRFADGTYRFYLDEQETMTIPDARVAIAYAYHPDLDIKGTLHKHGHPESVKAWYDKAVSAYRQAGFPEIAEQLFYAEGPISVEQLNKCLNVTGYVGKLHEEIQARGN